MKDFLDRRTFLERSLSGAASLLLPMTFLRSTLAFGEDALTRVKRSKACEKEFGPYIKSLSEGQITSSEPRLSEFCGWKPDPARHNFVGRATKSLYRAFVPGLNDEVPHGHDAYLDDKDLEYLAYKLELEKFKPQGSYTELRYFDQINSQTADVFVMKEPNTPGQWMQGRHYLDLIVSPVSNPESFLPNKTDSLKTKGLKFFRLKTFAAHTHSELIAQFSNRILVEDAVKMAKGQKVTHILTFAEVLPGTDRGADYKQIRAESIKADHVLELSLDGKALKKIAEYRKQAPWLKKG